LVIYCAGFNFLFELGTTLVFVPAIHRVIKVVVKQPVTDDEVGECEDVTCD
jgi:hypothetical protein